MSELTKFLVNAKKHSYASGNKAIKHDDGFEEFEYEEGGMEISRSISC